MSKWDIEKLEDAYGVMEFASGNKLYKGSYNSCSTLIRTLKKGVGFDGFTPRFMVRKFNSDDPEDDRDCETVSQYT